ncbi:MAG TPA: OsmC family protein [Candidatus Binatia bacterium]|jgi:uncharacterized OsmC-like protein|nr:OsmC family protein [Candidatus Binatia bacterium]
MPTVPGTIDLGKFRVVYEEKREQASGAPDDYLLQQRAIIRLNEALVKIEQPEDYTVYCNDENFKKQMGKRPSPLQYFIASIGFCMFSQFKRLAAKAEVALDDFEMDLRMTYDLSGRFPLKDFSQAAQGLSYLFNVKSAASAEKVIKVAQFADKGCHTVNSMRKRMPVAGKIILNDREYVIGD